MFRRCSRLTGALQLGQDLGAFEALAHHLQVGLDAADEAGALQDNRKTWDTRDTGTPTTGRNH